MADLNRRSGWSDRTSERGGWHCNHFALGGALRSVPQATACHRSVSPAWIAIEDRGQERLESPTIETFQRLLSRGAAPPIDPDSERVLVKGLGLGDRITELADGDLAVELDSGPGPEQLKYPLHRIVRCERWCDSLAWDSDAEREFATSWVPERLASWVAPLMVMQAPLETLVSGRGGGWPNDPPATAQQLRVDFLLMRPDGSYVAVEIDGPQHDESQSVDRWRDGRLRSVGVDVIRVPTSELAQGSGPNLEEIAKAVEGKREPEVFHPVLEGLAFAPAQVHRLAFALVEARAQGFITGARWSLKVADPVVAPGSDRPLSVQSLTPYLDLLAALSRIQGDEIAPDLVAIGCGGETLAWQWGDDGYAAVESQDGIEADCELHLEADRPPQAPLESAHAPRLYLRSGPVPVEPRAPRRTTGLAQPKARDESREWELERALRTVFAKSSFRDGQYEAIDRMLGRGDCMVLLPTGAGKSLIYQLVGLLLGGTTLVVDPLISLIEDQRRGLEMHGVDRIGSLSHDMPDKERAINEAEIRAGHCLFLLIAPERLQNERFQEQLQEMLQSSPVQLAVADEAHCVSEWGHSFRPAYLRIGRRLRAIGSAGTGYPPVVAGLTGTASRAVLHDALAELEIDRADPGAAIAPESFDRPELQFEVVRTVPGSVIEAVIDVVADMGERIGREEVPEFGELPGIIFSATIRGKLGVLKLAEALTKELKLEPVTYYGKAPSGTSAQAWSLTKRESASAFIEGRTAVMVATKAFGMGIDKPNVRYVLHVGIPGSIEAYYQEAGRAGRDRRPSSCVLITYTPDAFLPTAAGSLDEIKKGAAARSGTDVSTQQFFHVGTFQGRDAETKVLREVLKEMRPLGEGGRRQIPKAPNAAPKDAEKTSEARERALFRLVSLGVCREYFMKGQSFDAVMAKVESPEVVDNSIDYVRRSQPLLTRAHARKVGLLREVPVHEAAAGCGKALIEFAYETIERTRARALHEMAAAAADAAAGETREANGETLRARILAYLESGPAAELMEPLVEREDFESAAWIDALDELIERRIDPRDLRGDAARLLEDFPTHPGLLLARAFAELLDDGGSLNAFAEHLGLVFGPDGPMGSQEVELDELERVGVWISERAADARDGAHEIVHAVLTEADVLPDLRSRIGLQLLRSIAHQPRNGAAGLVARLEVARATADRALETLVR